MRVFLRDDRGSAPAEFVMVSGLLVALVLAVLQLALGLHVRNTVIDAAAEGAREAALAGSTDAAGVALTSRLIDLALGDDFAREISVGRSDWAGEPVAVITVHTTLPVLGLLGPTGALEVSGHAALETLD